MRFAAIVLGAGRSTRMGRDKITLDFGGKTVLQRSVEAFIDAGINDITLTYSEPTMAEAERLCALYGIRMIRGGNSRGESVYNALRITPCDIISIHDGARCLVSRDIIIDSIQTAASAGSGVAALPVRDTIWKDGQIIDRDGMYAAQTPQSFKYADILAAYEAAARDNFLSTDDCGIYCRMFGKASFSRGDIINQKLTTESDMVLFEGLTKELRTGYGEDTHRLTEGRRLILGGVDIPYRMGLLGHSDADVLTHAIIDAMLGAAAMGDIGRMFPDSSAEYKDISSLILLKQAWEAIREQGYAVCNIDATVIAQEPKLMPHIDTMRKNISYALGIDIGRVSIKATTPEHTGPEGNLECITARSACMLQR